MDSKEVLSCVKSIYHAISSQHTREISSDDFCVEQLIEDVRNRRSRESSQYSFAILYFSGVVSDAKNSFGSM